MGVYMDSADEQLDRQIGTVWALRVWWLLASTVGSIMSLALHASIREAIRGNISAIGFILGGAVIAAVVCFIQWTVLWSYLPEQAGSDWTRATGLSLAFAFSVIASVGMLSALVISFVGAISALSSRVIPNNSLIPFILIAIEVVLGVGGASTVGIVQGQVLRRYIGATTWRVWVRTSALVGAVTVLLSIVLIFGITGGAWLTGSLGIAILAGVPTALALVGLLRRPLPTTHC